MTEQWQLIQDKLYHEDAEALAVRLHYLGVPSVRLERDKLPTTNTSPTYRVYARMEIPELDIVEVAEAIGLKVLTADEPEDIDKWPPATHVLGGVCYRLPDDDTCQCKAIGPLFKRINLLGIKIKLEENAGQYIDLKQEQWALQRAIDDNYEEVRL